MGLKANREHPVIYVTGLVDRDGKKVIDMVQGNAAKDLRSWCASTDEDWLKAIKVVAADLAESYRAGLSPYLDHAVRVAIHFTSSASPTGVSTPFVDECRTIFSVIERVVLPARFLLSRKSA